MKEQKTIKISDIKNPRELLNLIEESTLHSLNGNKLFRGDIEYNMKNNFVSGYDPNTKLLETNKLKGSK